jgi:hypothetical protein
VRSTSSSPGKAAFDRTDVGSQRLGGSAVIAVFDLGAVDDHLRRAGAQRMDVDASGPCVVGADLELGHPLRDIFVELAVELLEVAEHGARGGDRRFAFLKRLDVAGELPFAVALERQIVGQQPPATVECVELELVHARADARGHLLERRRLRAEERIGALLERCSEPD